MNHTKDNDANIWFNGEIDLNTGKVLSINFGRNQEKIESIDR